MSTNSRGRRRAPPITASKLQLTAGERKALRRAGLSPSDLAHMRADDVIFATGEEITEERAEHLVGLATIIACGIGASLARRFVSAGIHNRSELASRSPEEMFLALLDQTSYTNPLAYDVLAQSVYLAGTSQPEPNRFLLATWTRMRKQRGFDPILFYWHHRHGEHTDPPRPTRRRLRLPTVGVNARICEGGIDASGQMVSPVKQKDVVCLADASTQLLVGHWMWGGGHGAFVRLEDLQRGDAVQVADEWFGVMTTKKVAAPVDLEPRDGELLLTTPPHLRVGTIGTPEMLKGVERGLMQVVVKARPRKSTEVNAKPRPLRPVRGAF